MSKYKVETNCQKQVKTQVETQSQKQTQSKQQSPNKQSQKNKVKQIKVWTTSKIKTLLAQLLELHSPTSNTSSKYSILGLCRRSYQLPGRQCLLNKVALLSNKKMLKPVTVWVQFGLRTSWKDSA